MTEAEVLQEYKDFELIFYYDNPGVKRKKWVNKENYINHYKLDWNCLIPVMDRLYQEHMSDFLLKAMMTFNLEECYSATIKAIKEL